MAGVVQTIVAENVDRTVKSGGRKTTFNTKSLLILIGLWHYNLLNESIILSMLFSHKHTQTCLKQDTFS